MSVIADLRADILKPDVTLSAVMRRAAVLAYRLKNEPMRVWVRKEQDGYGLQDADLPPIPCG